MSEEVKNEPAKEPEPTNVDIPGQAFIDPNKVDPTKFSEAIKMANEQIKESVKIIDSMCAESREKRELVVKHYEAELQKLSTLKDSYDKVKSAAQSRKSAIEAYNKESSANLKKANEEMQAIDNKISIGNQNAKAAEQKFNDCKNQFNGLVDAIDGKMVSLNKLFAKKITDANSVMELCNSYVGGVIAPADWKKGEVVKTKLRAFVPNNQADQATKITELTGTIGADPTIKPILDACLNMNEQVKSLSDSTKLKEENKKNEDNKNKVKAKVNVLQGQQIDTSKIDACNIDDIEKVLNEKIEDCKNKLEEARMILKNHDSDFYKDAPVIDLESGWKVDQPKPEEGVKPEEPKAADPKPEGVNPDVPKQEEPKKD